MKKIINKIFERNNLEKVGNIEKINIGFTNEIYSVNDKYILKICNNLKNEKDFSKEVYFLDLFKNKIPVAKLIKYDETKSFYEKNYLICEKIDWENLYSVWHQLNDFERKNIIKQLCNYLKIINKTDYKGYLKKFWKIENLNWQEKIISKINNNLDKISLSTEGFSPLKSSELEKLKNYINLNKKYLKNSKFWLVHSDIHFDNILVKDKKIVAILDFEKTEIASIDFVLDILKRMQENPSKYASEESEKFIKKQDYKNLLKWFKEFYPELFEFENLEKRLDLYDLEYNLKLLTMFPKEQVLKENILEIIK